MSNVNFQFLAFLMQWISSIFEKAGQHFQKMDNQGITVFLPHLRIFDSQIYL